MIAKGIMPDVIGPTGLVFCRICGACLLFWFFFAFKWQKVTRPDLAYLALCSFFGVFVNQVLFLNGLNLTSPINASLIMITIPISVFILSISFFREKITHRKLLGLLLGSVGFAYMVVVSNQSSKIASWQGDVMCAINAFSYGLYLVLVKKMMIKYRPLTVLSWLFLFGTIMIIPFGWNQFTVVEWTELSGHELFSILFVVVFVTFIVYFLSIYALSKISPTIVSSFTFTQPIAAAFFSWVYFLVLSSLGNDVTDYTSEINLSKSFSALLIFLGVFFVAIPRKQVTE